MTQNIITNPFRAVVNNATLDPLAGYDVEVWCTDLQTGQILDVGQFQSCTFTIRNATETYLPLGTRMPRYYDGEIQIAWVLERGKLSTDYLQAWFGTNDISADQYISRGPRFQITIDFNAVALAENVNGTTYVTKSGKKDSNTFFKPGEESNYLIQQRSAKGQLHLTRCKLDSMSTGIMPGRRIIADRWEGVAEGIWHQNTSDQNKLDLRSQVVRGQNISNAAPVLSNNNASAPNSNDFR